MLLDAYNFTLIHDADNHGAYAPSLNAKGTAAFAWNPSVRDSNIETGDGGALTTILNCLFCAFGRSAPAINERGAVAFFASFAVDPPVKDVNNGIFRYDADGLTLLAGDSPGSPFKDFGPRDASAPSMSATGTVAFFATLAGGDSGIFTTSDGKTYTAVVNTGDRFSELGTAPAINADGTVAFWARLADGGSGIFTVTDGVVTPIADTTDGYFSSFGDAPSLNNAGTVAFFATLSGGSGIFTGDGTELVPIATTGQHLADFDPVPSINNDGTVAYLAQLRDGRRAIFTSTGGPVIATGDFLFDGTVTSLRFFRQGLNDADSVGFWALVANESRVVRADVAPSGHVRHAEAVAVVHEASLGEKGPFLIVGKDDLSFSGPEPAIDFFAENGRDRGSDASLGRTVVALIGSSVGDQRPLRRWSWPAPQSGQRLKELPPEGPQTWLGSGRIVLDPE
jgi:hypothetical protein